MCTHFMTESLPIIHYYLHTFQSYSVINTGHLVILIFSPDYQEQTCMLLKTIAKSLVGIGAVFLKNYLSLEKV